MKKEKDERKRTNTIKKQSEEPRGSSPSSDGSRKQDKRYLDWDARDLKTYGWVSKSGRSTEGRFTNRLWEEEE